MYRFLVILSDVEYILSSAYNLPRRKRLLFDYLRIRIKATFNRWFHFKHQRFLSYHVEFPDFEVFFSTLRQVFVRQAYYFETDTDAPVIIDCGGNIGMSVLYFKYLYPKAQIIVFEPSREVIDVLRANIEKNAISGVTIINAAVYDQDGEMTMYPRGSAACGNTLDAGIVRSTEMKEILEPYTVAVKRLSPFIKERNSVDLLKLDIEGSEGVVLGELVRTDVLKNCETIVMEYHHYRDARENALSHVLSLLETQNYDTKLYSDDIAPASMHSISALCIQATKIKL